jgi:hypothetical protein|uniref:Uncharacterized protein n=1 Tax=Sipha flava TaxID=143950 RepID=A0A2S2QIT8_9HEMI
MVKRQSSTKKPIASVIALKTQPNRTYSRTYHAYKLRDKRTRTRIHSNAVVPDAKGLSRPRGQTNVRTFASGNLIAGQRKWAGPGYDVRVSLSHEDVSGTA